MEIKIKGGFIVVTMVALTGYAIYLKGKFDAIHRIYNKGMRVCTINISEEKTEKE